MSLLLLVLSFCIATARSQSSWAQDDGLFDNFDGTELSPEWRIARRNWGGQVNGFDYNGGVLPELVRVENGHLVLEAHGNKYTGDIKGINRNFCERADGKRVGAAIATERYFASGSYEVRARIAPELGVASAFWTFHYQEYYQGEEPLFQEREVGGTDYYAINHEIDIEFPGRPAPESVGQSFERALVNTYVGENEDEYTATPPRLTQPQNDGNFHLYRFEWHTGSPTEEKRVEFYVDNMLVRILKTNVPTLASRFWLGVWFPRFWAGEPEFETSEMEVDWVRIVPYHEPGDNFDTPEHFSSHGWAEVGFPGECNRPPVEDFCSRFSEGVNSFSGVNDVAVDAEEGCGGGTSTANLTRITTGGVHDSEHLRFNFSVETNSGCGYQYSAAYMTIGEDSRGNNYRNMSDATGVKFYIQAPLSGQGTVWIKLNSYSNSDCLSEKLGINRRNEMKKEIFVSSLNSWTLVDIPFSSMTNYRDECPFLDTDIYNVGSLVFSVEQVRSGSLMIDNVEFYN